MQSTTTSTRGKLLIFAAPSGSGKSTLINFIMSQGLNIHFSISSTTRQPRGTEQHGREYYFLSVEEFRDNIAKDNFVEYEEVYEGRYYGTMRSEVEKRLEMGENVVFDVDVHGALNIKKQYGDQALCVFIMPPSVEELRRRLEGRATDAPEVIEQRMQRAEYEISRADDFDVRIINDDLETAKAQVLDVVKKFLSEK